MLTVLQQISCSTWPRGLNLGHKNYDNYRGLVILQYNKFYL